MQRVISYIDGFNLYFGLRKRGWRKYYWLDVAAVSRALLKPDQTLVGCHYFTAHLRAGTHSGQSLAKQRIWLDALATRPDIACHFGQYQFKTVECKHCGSSWTKPEEKMTDVNIATRLIVDAYKDNYDMALVVSGDSDLAPPIRHIREDFPNKRVLVAFPPERYAVQLCKAAHSYLHLGPAKLRNNLLPDEITGKDGFVLQRPDAWR